MNEFIIGSRGSRLAIAQAESVASAVESLNPEIKTRIEIITTSGDRLKSGRLADFGIGLFVKEIELALLDGRLDAAVHSLKDMPVEPTDGLIVAAVPERVDPSDALVSSVGRLADMPIGARVGSSSLRRRAQILAVKSGLRFQNMRGNLDTRLRKLADGECDAIVVAYAGLRRLGLVVDKHQDTLRYVDRTFTLERLGFDVCLPAAGQGALAVQVRKDDERALRIAASLDHPSSRAEVFAERALLSHLGGGCSIPVGVLAEALDEKLVIRACVVSPDGSVVVRVECFGLCREAEDLGTRAAGLLIESGGCEILSEMRRIVGAD
jgi:hydroxymethylbilane synthase